MHKLWQKKLELNYSKNVIDIVQYGSSVMENTKPNDIDIAVIYDKIPIKDQLNESQKIKKQLSKFSSIDFHIKSFDFYSLFDKSNFAREGILFYGVSILRKDYFCKMFGFTPRLQIFYSLEKLKKSEKVKFNYMLSGKGGKYGLLKKYGGKLIRPGMIEVSPEYENIFVSPMNEYTSSFDVRRIFSSI